jgi:D-alanyl-D-alanine carboxypeptidase
LTPAPTISAKSAILIDAESLEVLYQKNAFTKLPMASTTKIMTALIALESGDVHRQVKIDPRALGTEGSSIYLEKDETLSMRELVYALLLASANDAATALAIHVCGSVEAFAERMNDIARSLGLRNTHFVNPHGLHDSDHYTTAYELALITREAARNDIFRKITSTQRTVIRRDSKESARLLVNHNRLLSSYGGCFGVKTGFTKTSGRCLVSAAERDGMTFIAVTLDAPDDWNDHRVMLDAAFSQYRRSTPFPEGSVEYMLPISGSYQSSLLCRNARSLSVITDKDKTSDVTYKIYSRRLWLAPISSDQTVGKVIFMQNGKTIAECELRAAYFAAKRK